MSAWIQRIVPAASIAALVWLLAARIAGPSDLWDQAQPRTISYTTDIVVRGDWILPIEAGEFPATKPPLFNWLAAPAVRAFGFACEPAHKAPSIAALVVVFGMLVVAGNRLDRMVDRERAARLGWYAAMAYVASYPAFKLGYLARPDMLLVLLTLVGWCAATMLLTGPPPLRRGAARAALAAAFWIFTGLAALTKGPAAVILPLHALVAARTIHGTFRAAAPLGWTWGPLLAVAMPLAWVAAVWRIDAAHVRSVLWFDEIFGRVTGLGDEGSRRGPVDLVLGLPSMPAYFLVRFLPWSLLATGAAVALLRRRDGGPLWRRRGREGAALLDAIAFVAVVLAFFTFSAGKRADYLAPALAPAALLAAWMIRRVERRFAWAGAVAIALALVALAALTVNGLRTPRHAPGPGFGDDVIRFAHEAQRIIEAEPHALVCVWTLRTHVQALMGDVGPPARSRVDALIAQQSPFWVVAGRRQVLPQDFGELLARTRPVRVTPRARTRLFDRSPFWPGQMSLYLVEPVPSSAPDGPRAGTEALRSSSPAPEDSDKP